MTRRSRGFTMVEVMIALAILGIVAALALPAMRDVLRNNRRTVLANDLLASFLLARAEAARSGRAFVVCGIDDADGDGVVDAGEQDCAGTAWDDGWIVAEWSDADADAMLDNGELATPLRLYANTTDTLRATAALTGAPANGAIAFMPFNRSGTSGRVTICDPRGASHARAVDVAASGRPLLRSNDVEDPGAGVALTCP